MKNNNIIPESLFLKKEKLLLESVLSVDHVLWLINGAHTFVNDFFLLQNKDCGHCCTANSVVTGLVFWVSLEDSTRWQCGKSSRWEKLCFVSQCVAVIWVKKDVKEILCILMWRCKKNVTMTGNMWCLYCLCEKRIKNSTMNTFVPKVEHTATPIFAG